MGITFKLFEDYYSSLWHILIIIIIIISKYSCLIPLLFRVVFCFELEFLLNLNYLKKMQKYNQGRLVLLCLPYFFALLITSQFTGVSFLAPLNLAKTITFYFSTCPWWFVLALPFILINMNYLLCDDLWVKVSMYNDGVFSFLFSQVKLQQKTSVLSSRH